MVHPRISRAAFAVALPVMLAACSHATIAPSSPQDAFWSALSSHCNNAYAGQLVSDDAADADMRGADMIMHVRECAADRIAVPFHIREAGGEWDRSRTWVFTRTASGIRLKHDHRHADGTSDAVTMYGGDTGDGGTTGRQSFPVDAQSIALFRREGLDASVTNIWRVAVDPVSDPAARFSYALERRQERGAPADRDFRVSFDASRAVPAPPAPWGH